MIKRRNSKVVKIGNVCIGGENPIVVQSMTTTDTRNIKATINEIKRIERKLGKLVRVSVYDMECVNALKKIKNAISIPLIADIHFDWRLAIESIKQGVDKIRINPGNIGGKEKIRKIAEIAKSRGIPIRIGINWASLPRSLRKKSQPEKKANILKKYALQNIEILEKEGFNNIVISVKSSDVLTTILAYEYLAKECPYPFHLGITEAGTRFDGSIKSAIGIGILLYKGIGDTIRVSLSSSVEDEIDAGYQILKALHLSKYGIDITSCPTCGRKEIDVVKLTNDFKKKVSYIPLNLKVAIMGCVVNGPGEAQDADIGVAGIKKSAYLFKKGKIIKKIPKNKIISILINEINKIRKHGKFKC